MRYERILDALPGFISPVDVDVEEDGEFVNLIIMPQQELTAMDKKVIKDKLEKQNFLKLSDGTDPKTGAITFYLQDCSDEYLGESTATRVIEESTEDKRDALKQFENFANSNFFKYGKCRIELDETGSEVKLFRNQEREPDIDLPVAGTSIPYIIKALMEDICNKYF